MLVLEKEQLEEAAKMLRDGKTLVFRTETSYGLGCDATNQKAVDKIFQIKGRAFDKPLIVIAPDVLMARKYLAWNSFLDKISIKYWPGAVTVVADYIGDILKKGLGKIPKEYMLANGVVSVKGTLAIRVTSHPAAKFLAERLGRPVVATSANISGTGDLYDDREVIKTFLEKSVAPDLFLNYGVLPKAKPTTVVSVTQGKVETLRSGD